MKSNIIKSIIALAITAAIITFLCWYTKSRPGPASRTDSQPRLTAENKEAFFKEQVTPILDANASANAKALATLKAEIHSQFESYRKRVPVFTDDITGFGNKTKITWEAAKQMASDDKGKVKRHVTGKFEMHVVSAAKMQTDLERIIHSFRTDVEANKNRMLADIDAAVKADPRFSAAGVTLPKSFSRAMEEDIAAASQQAGKDATVLGGMTVLVSFASEEAVRYVVKVALTRVGASLASSMGATATASGGATVAGGTGGGGAGTLGGPGGVVVGVAAGVAVGIIVDYVMTERMEAKLNQECTTFLTNAEKELTTVPGGLVATAAEALVNIEKIENSAIQQQIQSLP